jgi:hypothetical protein
MPFNLKNPPKDLRKKIKKRHPDATKNEIKQFIHVWNSVYDRTGSEARAFAQAWGVLNQNSNLESSHRKSNKKETKKNVRKWERKNKIKVKKKSFLIAELIKIANHFDDLLLADDSESIDEFIKKNI